jgi:hypothetical protein
MVSPHERTSGAWAMNTTNASTLPADVPGYAKLQREIHDALRAQHPEWIQPGGDCPTCDFYQSRLAELLSLSLTTESSHARR